MEGNNISEEDKKKQQSRSSSLQISKETMGLEMIFENYLNEIEWISAELEEIVDEITNTEGNYIYYKL